MAQNHHSADQRPSHPLMLLRRPFQRLRVSHDFAGRLPHRDAPSMRRAHHYALENGLAADEGLLTAFESGKQLQGSQKTPENMHFSHSPNQLDEPKAQFVSGQVISA